jgi:hypothetical protein
MILTLLMSKTLVQGEARCDEPQGPMIKIACVFSIFGVKLHRVTPIAPLERA